MRIRSLIIAFLFSLLTVSTLFAQGRVQLGVGSPAPSLTVDYVKGSFDPSSGGVYVVEFWATWCAPCKKSIPHLTKIQEEYKDDGLTIIGVSTDEDQQTVETFVRVQGRKMDYTVAVDRRGRTARAWMNASGQNGIPVAFIVDKDGMIQWIGHPLNPEFDEILTKVMSGRYNLKKQQDASSSIRAARSARSGNSWNVASKAYDNAIAIDPFIFAELYVEHAQMLLLDKKDPTAAYAFIDKVIAERGPEDPELLTWFARDIADNEDIPEDVRRMDVAMRAATTARSLAEDQNNPMYLSAIAFVHFKNGDFDKAVELQREAYFSAKRKDKDKEKRTLESYKQQQQHAEVDG
jgi:thiol-disulfide isomerase/thioredoxin